MGSAVNRKRRYDASRRRRQAERTRERMLEVAERLFLANGYAATSVSDIAAEADVAPPTVYAAWGNKRRLLQRLVDIRVAGDEARVALLDRDWYRELLAEPDARQLLRRHARSVREILERSLAITLVLREAAGADPELKDDYRLHARDRRYTSQRAVTDELARRDLLRGDLAAETAADILWTLSSPETYEALVIDRGWTPATFERWLAGTLITALLPATVP